MLKTPASLKYEINILFCVLFTVLSNPFNVNPCTPISLSLYFITCLCVSYLLQVMIMCSTVSSSRHPSQNPVWCFPIIFSVLFRELCPNLNLVITASSLLFPIPTLSSLTFLCIWYKCLPFSSLSHLSCHLLLIFSQIMHFTSALLTFICTSTFSFVSALLASLSANSLPVMPTCAGTHINLTWHPL